MVQSNQQTENNTQSSSVHYTTVCVDTYGRVYDLSKEHPSWEQQKKGSERCIVRDAFTCTVEEAAHLKEKKRGRK